MYVNLIDMVRQDTGTMTSVQWLDAHREQLRLAPDERWIYHYLRGQCQLEEQKPSEVLQLIGNILGYYAAVDHDWSHGLRGLCKRLLDLKNKGDRWHG